MRKYIGPQSYCNWPDKEARDKMERAVLTIQTKADQIYNKFKSFFAYQVSKEIRHDRQVAEHHFRRETELSGKCLRLK